MGRVTNSGVTAAGNVNKASRTATFCYVSNYTTHTSFLNGSHCTLCRHPQIHQSASAVGPLLSLASGLNRLQETRLSGLRPLVEFFDYHRISRPGDLNQATSVSDSLFFGQAARGGGVCFPLPSALLDGKYTKIMVLPLLAHSGYHIILAISPVCSVFS